jgi:hypothetical protein
MPASVASNASAFDTWNAFWYVPTDTTRFLPNFTRILDHLRKKHNFALSPYDSSLLHYTYASFYQSGPNINSSGGAATSDASPTTFGNLTSARDFSGVERSFLASEDAYQAVRQLHLKNLVIPIVGDFAGTKALRTIGRYLTEHGTQLSAFYVSNVETYLNRAGTSGAFYQNVGTLPAHAKSALIRGVSPGSLCNIQRVVAAGFSGC